VRVRPHKRSGANLKRLTWDGMFSANLNEVRVQRLTWAESVNANPSIVRVPSRLRVKSKSGNLIFFVLYPCLSVFIRGSKSFAFNPSPVCPWFSFFASREKFWKHSFGGRLNRKKRRLKSFDFGNTLRVNEP